MERKAVLVCIFMTALVFSNSCGRTQKTIVGVWEAKVNELPAVELTVRDDKGQLDGTIVLYFQRNDTGTWKVERKLEEPLTETTFDGKTLFFKVSHARAHPDSGPNDPPVPYAFTPSSSQEGELRKLRSSYQEQESAIKLVKKR